eukprot:SAG31_NODE_25362_length_462_cov_2.060606_1_plen_104_part_10
MRAVHFYKFLQDKSKFSRVNLGFTTPTGLYSKSVKRNGKIQGTSSCMYMYCRIRKEELLSFIIFVCSLRSHSLYSLYSLSSPMRSCTRCTYVQCDLYLANGKSD